MAMPFVSALPVRLPMLQNDLAGMLASWMEGSPGLGLSSSNCRGDLEMIDRLRKDIGQSLVGLEGSESQEGIALIEKLHKYYHYLLECEEHGMVRNGVGGGESPSCEFVCLEWESSVLTSGPFKVQTANSLECERANVMWNLAALNAHQASKENLKTKLGWNKASKRLQSASGWLGQLLVLLKEECKDEPKQQAKHPPDMSATFVSFWQALLLAQAQHCVYESLTCVKRPMQLLAAKLAAAAKPLYGEVERIAQNDERSPEAALSECSEVVPKLVLFARAWGAYMSCMSEYHQSQIHREKKEWGQELSRLEVAYQHAAVCKTLCEESSLPPIELQILDELRTAVDDTLNVLETRVEVAERDNTETHKQAVPQQSELTEIRGEKLVKCEESLSRLLPSKTTEPIFQQTAASASVAAAAAPPSEAGIVHAVNNQNHYNNHVAAAAMKSTPLAMAPTPPLSTSTSISSSSLDQKKKASPTVGYSSSNLKTYAEVFRVEMNEIIAELARATEDQTESARLALAEVHLPHSLTAYRQEQSGGGLPEDLWQRVHVLQQENCIIQLKQDLWELKDAADLARATHEKITSLLEFDKKSDREFREANPDFEGHDAGEVQRSFWKPLSNYDKLLSSAQEGDSVLFRRLEQLDIEPKYNLLQFSKSQLDRLLPGARGGPPDSSMVADTEYLSHLLGELSALFQERANLMDLIRKELDSFDIVEAIKARIDPTRGSDRDLFDAMKYAQKAFDGMRYEIQANLEKQDELLGTIFHENERFMDARERTTNSQSADSCIVMIEDAIEEIGRLSKHLKEGKDFYNVVLPKLDELKHKVDDVSARLTVERLEYSEKKGRVDQELKDEEMAKQLSEPRETPSAGSADDVDVAGASSPEAASAPAASASSAASAPPSAAAAAGPSSSNVNDENVAMLVAMGFDSDKVTAALEKHNNDMDKALNELLSA